MMTIDPTVSADVDYSFSITFEQHCYDYWSIKLPPTRGCFRSERAAHIWAHENLHGIPYSVWFSEFEGTEESESKRLELPLWVWPKDRDCWPDATQLGANEDEREWDDPNMGGRDYDRV